VATEYRESLRRSGAAGSRVPDVLHRTTRQRVERNIHFLPGFSASSNLLHLGRTKLMDAPTTYAEIYLHEDGKKLLYSRVYDEQARAQVLREMQGKSFDVLLICNRCIVGASTYTYTDSRVLIREEYGACIGFLDRPF
jgi:hypothetical protein